MAVREDVIYHVRLEGAQKLAADANTVTAATDRMKTHARAAAVPIPGGMSAADQALYARMGASRAEAAALAARASRLPGGSAAETAAVAAATRGGLGRRAGALAGVAGLGRAAGFAGAFGGGPALVGAGVGFLALSQFNAAVRHEGEVQQLNAQTAAGIRSTGGAAHVTAGHIRDLAGRLSNLAGVEDESVQEAENILLTFRNVRNEVGQGNKIFDQSALAIANVAARMHTDMPQAALQIGKALNDPVNGLGALRRIGVQFTHGQEEQIKVMVAAGNTAGAQKIIIGELNREFGHSAELAGKTLPAAQVRLSEAWEDSRAKLVAGLMPAATDFTNWLAKELPGAVDTALTAMSLFDTDPRANALSRWLHRNWGGDVTGAVFDYLLENSGKDVVSDVKDSFFKSYLDDAIDVATPKYVDRLFGTATTNKQRDATGMRERIRQRNAVGGMMLDAKGNPVGEGWGMGGSTPFASPPVKIKWDAGDPLDSRPVILVADGSQIAKVVNKGQQKRTHSEGTGTSRRGG